MDDDIVATEPSPLADPEPHRSEQPPRRSVLWIFKGNDGIRAGWGVLLFILLYLLFALTTAWVARPFLITAHHIKELPVTLGLIIEAAQGLPALFATVIMALIERRSPLSYGFRGKARAIRFFSGLFWGFVALSVLVLALWKAHLLAFDGQSLHGSAIVKYAFGWAVMFLVVALFEESTLRGYLQYTLTRGIGFWWGALLLSFVFGFSHGTNPGETPVGLFGAAAIGLVFCISLWYTGSLWWALGCHASWDWAESYFYGTSDSGMVSQGHLLSEHPMGPKLWSGGVTGPEGSLLALMLVVLMAVCMWLWWGRRTQSPFQGNGWKPYPSTKPAPALQTELEKPAF